MAVKASNIQEVLAQLIGQSGTAHAFPLLTRGAAPSATRQDDPPSLDWFCDLSNWFWFVEDFIRDTDLSDEAFTIYDKSASGSPTAGVIADATGGQYRLKLASTSEAEDLFWTLNGNLPIDSAKPFVFLARCMTAHAMAAAQRVIVGLGSDYTTILDDITRNIWFRQEADTDLLIEVDDATTDTDDFDTGKDISEDAWVEYMIVKGYDGTIFFCVKDNKGQNFQMLKMVDGSGFSGNLQPILGVQKDSGTTTPELLVDYVAFCGARALT